MEHFTRKQVAGGSTSRNSSHTLDTIFSCGHIVAGLGQDAIATNIRELYTAPYFTGFYSDNRAYNTHMAA